MSDSESGGWAVVDKYGDPDPERYASRQWARKAIRDELRAAFGRDGLSVAFIPAREATEKSQ